ncbi:MAG TPA: hypothetical protein VFG51_02050 [Candidatus Saccharimonadia bacterium]|nr:hypothetical protein [Candidatus Saccharimonadia bacterium]
MNIINQQHNKYLGTKGSTLVELLLYMGLISILLVVMTTMFLSALDVQQSSQSTSSAEQEGNYLLTRLAYDIHRASSVTTPAALGSSSPTLTLVISGASYTYSVSNGQLSLVQGITSEFLSGFDTTISNLSFTRLGNVTGKPTLKISFTVHGLGTSSQPEEIRQYQSSVGLR